MSKLTEEMMKEIQAELSNKKNAGETARQIFKRFGVSDGLYYRRKKELKIPAKRLSRSPQLITIPIKNESAEVVVLVGNADHIIQILGHFRLGAV